MIKGCTGAELAVGVLMLLGEEEGLLTLALVSFATVTDIVDPGFPVFAPIDVVTFSFDDPTAEDGPVFRRFDSIGTLLNYIYTQLQSQERT